MGARVHHAYNLCVKNTDHQHYLAAWNIAANALARERMARLRAMTDADTQRAIAQLFSVGPGPNVDRRPISGLVEQQRLFRRLR